MRYVFLILIISFAWAADPPEVKLPPDVQKVVDARDKEVAKAKAAYDDAVFRANVIGSKAMEAVMKAKMARQDLDGAVAAKEIVKKWKSEEPDDGDLLGEGRVDLSKIIVGKWKGNIGPIVQGIWTFEKGGSGNFQGNNLQSNGPQNHTFKWIVEDDKVKVDIDLKGKYFCYFKPTQSDFKGTAWVSTEEDSVTATRVPTK